MHAPDYFSVAYVINPWMEGQIAHVSNQAAREQWANLHKEIERHAKVALQPTKKGLPEDIVFTANAGLVFKGKAIVSRFRCVERRLEEMQDRVWFAENGFEILNWPREVSFEGAGDALSDQRAGIAVGRAWLPLRCSRP